MQPTIERGNMREGDFGRRKHPLDEREFPIPMQRPLKMGLGFLKLCICANGSLQCRATIRFWVLQSDKDQSGPEFSVPRTDMNAVEIAVLDGTSALRHPLRCSLNAALALHICGLLIKQPFRCDQLLDSRDYLVVLIHCCLSLFLREHPIYALRIT